MISFLSRASAGCKDKVSGLKEEGLSSGVLAADDPPLPKVRLRRPEIELMDAMGDGTGPESSSSSLSDESPALSFSFPLFTSERDCSHSLRRNFRTSFVVIEWRNVFPVSGSWGFRLHFSLLTLHVAHGPMGLTLQTLPPSAHRVHCYNPLALSQLKGQRHTWKSGILSKYLLRISSESLPSNSFPAGPARFVDWA